MSFSWSKVMSDSWQPSKQRRSFNLAIKVQHSMTPIYLSRIISYSSLIQNFCFSHCSFIHFFTYMPRSISWLERSSSPLTPIKICMFFKVQFRIHLLFEISLDYSSQKQALHPLNSWRTRWCCNSSFIGRYMYYPPC